MVSAIGRALVTGVAGFIGSRLAGELLERGVEVVGIDSLSDYYDPRIKRANVAALTARGLAFVEGDLNALDLAALVDADVVFHLAGQPGVRQSWGSEFRNYTRDNVEATQALLEAVKGSPRVRRLVYASSSSVYGSAERFPTLETDRPRPLSPYGVTKLAAEHLCGLYAESFGLPAVTLRYFTVYGPGQRPDMAFHRFITAALRGEPIRVYGTGEQVREFTYVDDVVRATLLAAERGLAPGAVINVSGGASVSVAETLAVIERIHGAPLRIAREAAAPGDVHRTGGSVELAAELLGWAPEVGIEDGLEAEYRWLRAAPAG